MTLLILILIAIPVCILTILLWIYNDYKKYKRQNCFLILLFLALPATIQAQYTDKNCCVNSKWHENPKEILEHTTGSFTTFPVVDNKPQFFNTFNFIITPIKIDYDTPRH